MPGCRDSEIAVFACANACGVEAIRRGNATAQAQVPRILLFIRDPPPVAPVLLTDLRKGTNTLVHLASRRPPGIRPAIKASHPNELLAGHFTPSAKPIRRPPRPCQARGAPGVRAATPHRFLAR